MFPYLAVMSWTDERFCFVTGATTSASFIFEPVMPVIVVYPLCEHLVVSFLEVRD